MIEKLNSWARFLISAALPLLANSGYSQVNLETEATAESKKTVSARIYFQHFVPQKADRDQTTYAALIAGYKLTDLWSLSLLQGATKLYAIDPGDEEFATDDTIIGLAAKVPESYPWINITPRVRYYWPTSTMSRRNDINGAVRASVILASEDLSPFTLTLEPRYAVYFSEYTTTPTTPGSGGGTPLVRSRLDAYLALSWSILEKLYISAETIYGHAEYGDFLVSDQLKPLAPDESARTYYYWDFSVGYDMTKHWNLTAGYTLSSNLENQGRIEYYMFDGEIGQYYLSTTVKM